MCIVSLVKQNVVFLIRSGSNHPGHKVNGWMDELSWFFQCSYMVSGKLKVTLGMHMVKYGCDLSGPGTLTSAMSQK